MPVAEGRLDYFNRQTSAMRQERESFITHYAELAEFITPRKGRFFIQDRNKGDKRWSKIINSKATQAHRKARAGMLAGVMSAARPWFALETPDPDMMEYFPVKVWLYRVEQLMRAVLNASNFYNMAPTMIGELLLFATGAMLHVDDFEDVARFYTFTAGEYMIAQDDRLAVRTIAREYETTVAQMVAQFGLDRVSESVRTKYDNGDYHVWYPVTHFIEKNPEADGSKKSSEFMPFRSVYYEPGTEKMPSKGDGLLRKSGFLEFPAYCPRWDVTGEDIYGTDCPAMQALGDIKGLQIQERRKAQGLDKMINPPLVGPASVRNVPISGLPGGATLYDGNPQGVKLGPLYQVNPPFGELSLDMQRVERRIDEAFYVDLFLAITNMEGIQPKNQFELAQRDQERLLQLGPVLERLHSEFAGLMITRLFNQLVRADLLKGVLAPPPELSNVNLKISYISTLAMAQRAVATRAIDDMAGFVAGLVGSGMTDATDKFDYDQAIDERAAITGVPPRLIVPDEIVVQKRQKRMQDQQMAQQMAMAQAAAQTGKTLADAGTSDPSLLTAANDTIKKNIGA